MNLTQHLIALSEAPGISGYEGPVRAILQAAWEGLADEMSVDRLGTLVATKVGSGPEPRPRILITAHMDEIGLMVKAIEDGFLHITGVGGVDPRVLPNQPVIVHGERPLPALIATRPPHVLPKEEREKHQYISQLRVDTGLPAREVEKLVRIGDPVSFDQKAVELGDGILSGKSLDNRVSCAALTMILEELQTRSHRWDVLVAATVMEEVELQGGETIGWHTRPDIALVIDTTFATGNGVGEDEGFKMGEGPAIVVGPNTHPRLLDMIRCQTETLECKLQQEPISGSSGTEGWAIQVSRDGIPTAVLDIPIRNMHSPVEVVVLKDIERTARLVVEFIMGLDGDTLNKLSLDYED
jgi:putative aminopeptidase FrvX